MNNYKNLVENYFKIWNNHNSKELGSLFSENAYLRDWDIFVEGKQNIINANQNIFNSFPYISIKIENIHISTDTNTVTNEILVKLNNQNNDILKVVDIIEYNNNGLIKSLRAYKG